jgi:hypothetical protein
MVAETPKQFYSRERCTTQCTYYRYMKIQVLPFRQDTYLIVCSYYIGYKSEPMFVNEGQYFTWSQHWFCIKRKGLFTWVLFLMLRSANDQPLCRQPLLVAIRACEQDDRGTRFEWKLGYEFHVLHGRVGGGSSCGWSVIAGVMYEKVSSTVLKAWCFRVRLCHLRSHV